MIEHYYTNDQIFGENWFTYPNLYKRVVEEFPSGSKFVEVGSWKGRSSACLAVEIANSGKEIDLYCVDTWEGSVEHKDYDNINSLYDVFIENMKPVEKYYFPLKISSVDASKKFKDKSLDFVFLDASHEYEDVKNDIIKWLPKVKPGGILAGHDYYVDGHDWFPGVKQAVNEQLKNFEVGERCFVYRVPVTPLDKLQNFPSVNFISIEQSEDRRKLLYENFEKYGITNITPHIYKKYDPSDHKIIEGEIPFNDAGRGPVTSHLKTIKEWYENTDEEYTIICEDDFCFDSIEYWNFTWKEFFDRLPEDWTCVQLCVVRQDMFYFFRPEVKLRPRCYDDWSGCAYLIRREHAKNLVENYFVDDHIHLQYKGTDKHLRALELNAMYFLLPQIENLVYSVFDTHPKYNKVYTFPLFLENVYTFESTWVLNNMNWLNKKSYDDIIEWWKTKGKDLSIDELI